jgi:hypothetical protein
MSAIGQSKWRCLGALVLIAALVFGGAAAFARTSFTVDRRVAMAKGPVLRPHVLAWTWPAEVRDIPGSDSVGELLASSSVCQAFIADHTGLSFVEVNLATYARDNTGPVVFHLKTSPDATEDLVTLTFAASGVENNAYRMFEFPPIRDSAGRQFTFCLEAPEAEQGNAITVWGHTEDVYPAGEAILQGVPDHGVRDLSFRVGYSPPVLEKLSILLNRIVEHKSLVWADKFLYILLALAYVALLYVLFVRVMETLSSGSEDDG